MAVLAAAAVTVPIPVASATGTATSYATSQPLCPPAKAGHAQCFAMRLHRTSPSTPGARPFALAAGAATIGPAGGLTPSDLATAYGFNSAAVVTQTVGIIDWGDDPTIAADLQTFDTNYGLAACTTANGCFKKLNQAGAATPLPTVQGTAGEIALDVEAVHAVCQTCKIVLIEATDNSFANIEAAVNKAAALGATEISNSYGGAEGTPGAADLAAYNHPGVAITVSTGDDGYFGFDLYPNTVSAPAANPGRANFPSNLATVVSVGGTSLLLNQNGTRQSEYVWNNNGTGDHLEGIIGTPQGAEGGGCSSVVTAPAWQQGLAVWAQTACGTKRLAADVSAVADPYTGFDTYDTTGSTGWGTIGGTSLSAPIIAALFGLAGGAHGVANPALTLYGHLGSTSLYDVTVGGNGYCGGEGSAQCPNANHYTFNGVPLGVMDCSYPATGTVPSAGNRACDANVGYDGPSGVGTPAGLGALAPTGPHPVITGPASVAHGVTNTFSAATSTDPFPGGHVTSWVWNWGDGTANSSGVSVSHNYATGPATRVITLTETDNYGQKGTLTRSEPVS